MNEPSLLPCPLCGGPAVMGAHYAAQGAPTIHFVECQSCPVRIGACAERDVAAAVWNQRSDTALREVSAAALAFDRAVADHDAASLNWRVAAERYNRSEGAPAATDAVNMASDAEYEARKKRQDARDHLAALLPATPEPAP